MRRRRTRRRIAALVIAALLVPVGLPHNDDAAAVEPAALDPGRWSGALEPRGVARRQGRELVLQLAGTVRRAARRCGRCQRWAWSIRGPRGRRTTWPRALRAAAGATGDPALAGEGVAPGPALGGRAGAGARDRLPARPQLSPRRRLLGVDRRKRHPARPLPEPLRAAHRLAARPRATPIQRYRACDLQQRLHPQRERRLLGERPHIRAARARVRDLVGYTDGRVNIIDWRSGPNALPGMVLARQNVPLIVTGGRPNPSSARTARCGDTLETPSGVALRSRHRPPRQPDLRGRRPDGRLDGDHGARGGRARVELDINAEWPTFNTYGARGAHRLAMMVPNSQQSATRYLVPDDRDFFAVYLRNPAARGGFRCRCGDRRGLPRRRAAPDRLDAPPPPAPACTASATPAMSPGSSPAVRAGGIARGLGRSYGDAARAAGGDVIDVTGLDRARVRCGRRVDHRRAGVSIGALMRRVLPEGWCVGVTPGTAHVTVGGRSPPTHGKNHHVDGGFCDHVIDAVASCHIATSTTLRRDRGITSPVAACAQFGGLDPHCVHWLPADIAGCRCASEDALPLRVWPGSTPCLRLCKRSIRLASTVAMLARCVPTESRPARPPPGTACVHAALHAPRPSASVCLLPLDTTGDWN